MSVMFKRTCIAIGILGLAALFTLNSITFRRSSSFNPRKDSPETIVTLFSSDPTKTEFQGHLKEKFDDVSKSKIANTFERRYYREASRVRIKGIYFKAKVELLKAEVDQLSSTRITLNFSKEETSKHKDSNEYKEALKAGATLEAKKGQLLESLLKKKHLEELLFLAHHRPHAFIRHQHISRQGIPAFSYLLRRQLQRRQAQQGAAANP